MFTPTVPHVTVIANGFQPHSRAECHTGGCVVRWCTWVRIEGHTLSVNPAQQREAAPGSAPLYAVSRGKVTLDAETSRFAPANKKC